MGLIIAGVLAVLYGFIMLHPFEHGSHGEHTGKHAFGQYSYKTVFWLLTVNASMFFIYCIQPWQWEAGRLHFVVYRKLFPSVVPILGLIVFIVLMAIIWVDVQIFIIGSIRIYMTRHLHLMIKILDGKKDLTRCFFYHYFSRYDSGLDLTGPQDEGNEPEIRPEMVRWIMKQEKWIWDNTVWASLFTVFFGLTVASTPWLWLMSIDAHWYSHVQLVYIC